MFTNYINDSAKALDSIMVLDDTYLFYSESFSNNEQATSKRCRMV